MTDDMQETPSYKVVEEPGIKFTATKKLIGYHRCLQPCDEDQNPIEGQRIRVSFVVQREQPRDRSRYMPNECDRQRNRS